MALTSIPAAGAKLRASTLNSLVTEVRTVYGLVGSDQNVGPSNTTFQDVTGLGLTVVANAIYEIRAYIQYSSNSTADVKFQFTLPTLATMDTLGAGFTAAGEAMSFFRGTGGSAAVGGSVNAVQFLGTVTTGANAGTVQLQAAQNTSTAVTTNIETGSYIGLTRLA